MPEELTIQNLYDRIRMLDDPNYPKSFIDYGNLKIEFSDTSIIENQLVCKAKIKILSDE